MSSRRPPAGPGRPVRRPSPPGATALATREADAPVGASEGAAPRLRPARDRTAPARPVALGVLGLLRTRAGLCVVLAVVLLTGTGYAALGTSLLGVRAVEVRGATGISAASVRAAAHVPVGYPLPRVDPDAVARRVQALPAVRSATVQRVWPRTLRVTVVPRTPVAIVAAGSGWAWVDASGVAYAAASASAARRGASPVIRTRRGDEAALRSAAAVVAVLPHDLVSRVATVDAQSGDSVVLRLRPKGQVVWGSPEDSTRKAQVLAVLMRAEQHAGTYDVSAPDAPTVR